MSFKVPNPFSFLYVSRNNLQDDDSDRSLGIEATFWKTIRKKDKKGISKFENPNLLTSRNFMMYSRSRLLSDTSTIFQLASSKKFSRKKLEDALFLNPQNHALIFFDNGLRDEIENKVCSVGRDFAGHQETVALVTNRKQLEFMVDLILKNDSFYIQPLNLQDVGSRASYYTEDHLKRLGKYGVALMVLFIMYKNSFFTSG